MFGSIFGFEDIIEPLWIRPIDHMTTLPFLGKLNTVFIVAVAFGMFLIIVAMILHIINAAKSKDIESTWFDPNGVAGLIFYIAVVVTIVLFMTGNPLPGGIVMGIMFGVPLLLIFLKEPLTRMIEKRADKMETGPGMYAVQGFFEMFETLLSYFSNTISFIRIGAFAVSHAAIMETGQDHQLNVVLLQNRKNPVFKRFPEGKVLFQNRRRCNPRLFRTGQRIGIRFVGKHQNDLPACKNALGLGIDQRLKIGSAARNQHCDPCLSQHRITPSVPATISPIR